MTEHKSQRDGAYFKVPLHKAKQTGADICAVPDVSANSAGQVYCPRSRGNLSDFPCGDCRFLSFRSKSLKLLPPVPLFTPSLQPPQLFVSCTLLLQDTHIPRSHEETLGS